MFSYTSDFSIALRGLPGTQRADFTNARVIQICSKGEERQRLLKSIVSVVTTPSIQLFRDYLARVSAAQNTVSNTNSTKHASFREPNSSSVSQEISRTLWNLEVYYRVHNSRSLVPILSQINPAHGLPSYSFEFYFSTHYFNIIHLILKIRYLRANDIIFII